MGIQNNLQSEGWECWIENNKELKGIGREKWERDLTPTAVSQCSTWIWRPVARIESGVTKYRHEEEERANPNPDYAADCDSYSCNWF